MYNPDPPNGLNKDQDTNSDNNSLMALKILIMKKKKMRKLPQSKTIFRLLFDLYFFQISATIN